MMELRGLYAIVDVGALEQRALDPIAFAEAVLDARPAAVQLRDKGGGAKGTLRLLRALRPLAARAGVPLFANDRPDLALVAQCDGVHLGQEDLPIDVARDLVRKVAGGARMRFGISTHDQRQLDDALAAAPDYVAIGPIFATRSKDRPSAVVGVDRLAALRARARGRAPVVAIGGIGVDEVAAVAVHCDAVAVIAALLPHGVGAAALDEVRARAHALDAAIRAARSGDAGQVGA